MAQIYGHSQRLFDLATAARDRVRASVSDRPDYRNPEASTAVIMAVVAAEGFINELAESAGMMAQCGLGDVEANNKLASLSRLLELVEEEHGGLLLKYQLASQILSGRTFEPGCNPGPTRHRFSKIPSPRRISSRKLGSRAAAKRFRAMLSLDG